jgi:NADP-dependent 3-hydroxy acid dehydrogenase YdfG
MPRRQIPIDGLTAHVSGAASGIGRAMALRLAAHGCPVALVDLDEEGLAETAALIDTPVLARVLDVRDREGQFAFAAEVARWAPRPIGMVLNNAGVAVAQTVAGGSAQDDAWLLEINVGGVVHGTRAFLPILQRQGAGVIVNVSSVFGLIAVPGQSAYCASKFAVRGFTESLREELRRDRSGVSACVVHPGGVATNIARNARYPGVPGGRGPAREEAIAQFDALARTSPQRAAEIIHRGVRAGRGRILVGPDARALDLLARLSPARAGHLLALAERRLGLG